MGVLRLGHVEIYVTDFDKTVDYYTRTLGLEETGRQGNRIYLKCFDEYDHHSVILHLSDRPGLHHAGLKVENADDLEQFEKALETYGLQVERIGAGEEYKQGEAIRFRVPTGQFFELYYEMEQPGRAVGNVNPEPWPEQRVGISPYHLDHMLVGGKDIRENVKIFREILGFHLAEQVLGPDNETMIGAFLHRTYTPHDIAFLNYPEDNVFHHVSFWLENKHEVLDAGDILGRDGIEIEKGPDRHGITRGLTIYYFDPSGNRNEVFTSAYLAQPDMPIVTWTFDDVGLGETEGKGGYTMNRKKGLPHSFATRYTLAR